MHYLQRYNELIHRIQSDPCYKRQDIRADVLNLMDSPDFGHAVTDFRLANFFKPNIEKAEVLIALPLLKKVHFTRPFHLPVAIGYKSNYIVHPLQDQRDKLKRSHEYTDFLKDTGFNTFEAPYILFTIDGEFLYLDGITAVPLMTALYVANIVTPEQFTLHSLISPLNSFNPYHSL